MKRLLSIERDDTLTFEEMGIDSLFVDEAHNYKNLAYYSKLQVPGVTNAPSQQAQDMYMKTNYMRDINGRIVFATATPITNSIAEMYNMTRFVYPEALKQAGLDSFDAWAATFGEIVSKAEVAPDGRSLRIKERFSRFNNVPEMIGMFRQFADVLRTEDVVKDLPKAKHVDVISPSTPIHDKYIDEIMARIKTMSSGQKQSDNMLLITNDGRAMATDMRLVASQLGMNPTELDIPTSRINKAVGNILTEYKGSIDGTQFVFLDFGMTDKEEGRYNFNLYADIKMKLVKGGIPSKEIADIGNYDTVQKKEDLFKAMNKGEIRVLMGSTAKMGEGVNAQKKAVALHHLNAPYRPSDIEQREGRIVRFGNENPEVTIYKYIQEKSFDSYMWQMLARKGQFINQAMSGLGEGSLEEVDEFVLSAQNAMAIATGNPLIMRQIEADQELKQLTIAKNAYLNNQNQLQDRLAALPSEIKKLQETIPSMKTDSELATSTMKQPFSMTVGNTTFEKQGEAGTAILNVLKGKPVKYDTPYSLGTYRGFDLKYSISGTSYNKYIYADGKRRYTITASESNTGIVARINNAINDIPKDLNETTELERARKEELTTVKDEIGKPFSKQADIEKLTAELARINTQLMQDTGIEDGVAEVFDVSDDVNQEVDAYMGYGTPANDIWKERTPVTASKAPDLTSLTAELSTRFGIPVNKGKLKTKGSQAEYKHQAGTIRVRTENNIPVLAHELGHHFDNKYSIILNNPSGFDDVIKFYNNNLLDMGYEDNQIPTESLAEYFRDYISNRKETAEKFPPFTETLKSTLNNADWRNLNAYADNVNAYLSATSDERFRTTIHKRQTHNKFVQQAKLIANNPNTALDKFVFNWIDMYSVIKYAELKATGTTQVYDKIMLSNNLDLKVDQTLRNGLYDLSGNIIAPALKDHITYMLNESDYKPVDTKRDFSLYLKNRRAAELVERGIRAYADDTLNNQAAIQNSIAQLDDKYPHFNEAAKGIYEFQNMIMYEYAVKTGLISEDQYSRMMEVNQNYVPFFRVLDTLGKNETRKGIANQHSPVKRIYGSGLDTYDPIENIVYNTSAIIKAGTRNAVMQNLAELADTVEGFGIYMEKIPPDMVADVVSVKQIKDQIEKLSKGNELKTIADKLDDDEMKFLMDTITNSFSDTIKVWRSKRSNKQNVVSVKRGGEYQYYEVHDKNFLEAIKSFTPGQSSIILEGMRKLTSTFKVLTTGANPFFGITNIMRDFQTGFVNTTTTNNPIKYTADWVKAVAGAVFESDAYKDYLANGGGYMGSVTADARIFRQTMREITEADRNKIVKSLHNMKNVTDNIMWFVNKGDDIPRFAEYKRTLAKTGDKLAAGRAAQEITVNFRRTGKTAAELNKMIPYFNAAIQANHKMLDTFAFKGYDEFLKTGSKSDVAKKLLPNFLKFIMGSLIGAVLVQFWNRVIAPELFGTDPNDFENASSYMKNNYYLYSLPNGKFIRVPKPQNLGVLGTAMERALDLYMFDDPNAYYNFGEYVGQHFLPPAAVTLFGTVYELGTNRNFAGIPIVPSYMEDLDKRLQYDDSTSAVAYIAGRLLNVSPKQVDHVMSSNLGFLARLNKALFPVNRDKADITGGLENQFVVDSVYSTDIVNRFYDEREKYTVMAKSYDITNGEDDRYLFEDIYNKYKYDRYANLYSNVTKDIRDLDDEEKRRNVRSTLNTIIGDMTNTGMTELDEFVSYVCQEYDYEIADLAPYVTVPSALYLKYQDKSGNHYVTDDNKQRIKIELRYDDMIAYHRYFQDTIMPVYEHVLNMQGVNPETGLPITDQDKAEYMKYFKDKLVKEMEIMFGQELFKKYQ